MDNPFYVSPLGGLDVGGTVRQTFSDIRNNELMDMKRTEFEQQQQDRESQSENQSMLRELGAKAMGGDINALQEIYTIDPSMGQKIREGAGIRDEAQAKQASSWLEQYHAKASADPKAAYEWLQQTAAKSPVEFDDQFLGMSPEETHQRIMFATPAFFNKDQLAMLQGGGASPEYSNIKRGEDGNLYGLNKQTQQMERIKSPEGVSFGGDGGQTINVNTGVDEQGKVIDKYQGEAFVSTQKNATDARAQLQSLNSLDALSEKAFSGTAANLKKNAAKLAGAFGVDVEGLSETEIFDSVANELVLGKTAMMTGVLTDRDMEFLQSTVPQLTQTADGRKKLIKIAKKIAERKIEYAKEAAKFRRENKGKFNQYDFENYLAEMNDGKDFLSDYYPTDDAGVTDFSNVSTEDLMKTAFGGE